MVTLLVNLYLFVLSCHFASLPQKWLLFYHQHHSNHLLRTFSGNHYAKFCYSPFSAPPPTSLAPIPTPPTPAFHVLQLFLEIEIVIFRSTSTISAQPRKVFKNYSTSSQIIRLFSHWKTPQKANTSFFHPAQRITQTTAPVKIQLRKSCLLLREGYTRRGTAPKKVKN